MAILTYFRFWSKWDFRRIGYFKAKKGSKLDFDPVKRLVEVDLG